MEKITNICIGMKETLRAIAEGRVSEVILADNADAAFKTRIRLAAEKHKVPVHSTACKAELGKQAGIDVPAAVVGRLKNS